MSDLLKLLLVEDDELFRLGLITCFQQEPKIELVLEAADGEAALELVKQHKFDVAILDLMLPGLDGIETCRRLQKLDPKLPIFVLTSNPNKDMVLKSIEVGAKGYCLKGIEAEKLVLAIRSLAAGATWWDASASERIYRSICQTDRSSQLGEEFNLTKRELEVLTLITNGKSNQQIAEILFITSGTVRVHVHTILQKLNVSDRTQAAIFAIQHQLVE